MRDDDGGRFCRKLRPPAGLQDGVHVSQPRLSIIVTLYNEREFAHAALDSVLAQRLDGTEVIAVDDGSTDGTAELLAEYGDSLRTLLLERNAGVTVARNAGAAVATGDYLAFLDGDDAFMPWTLEVYEKLIEEIEPLVIIGERLWFEGAMPEPGPFPEEIRFVQYDDFFGRDRSITIGSSTLVIRRAAWEQVGGLRPSDPSARAVPALEELDLLWRLGTSGRVVAVMAPPTAFYRVHPRQATWHTQRQLEAASTLCSRERRGEYPGGCRRRLERRACIGGQVVFWTRTGLRSGAYRLSLRLLLRNSTFAIAAVAVRAPRLVAGRIPQTALLL